MTVTVNQPDVIAVTAVSESVYQVTVTPAPAVQVTATASQVIRGVVGFNGFFE